MRAQPLEVSGVLDKGRGRGHTGPYQALLASLPMPPRGRVATAKTTAMVNLQKNQNAQKQGTTP